MVVSTTSESPRHRRPGPADHVLAVDTRSLGRTPGATMEFRRTIEVPERIGVELMWLPEASPLDLDLTFTCVEEGVLVTGPASGVATIECARCLGTQSVPVGVELTELYAYRGTPTAEAVDQDEVRLLDGDVVDLLPALIDAFGLEFPLAPTCEMAGVSGCVDTETPPPDGISGEQDGRIDPRWAALAEKFGTGDAASDHDTTGATEDDRR